MRRKQHSNRHKRIRKAIESALEGAGIPFANVYDRLLLCHMVRSTRMRVSIPRELSHDFPSLVDWGKPVQVFENTALQWTNSPESPRGIYLRVKKRVSTIRRKERAGLLRELRDRVSRRVAESVEHARAASVQREYEAVPGVSRLGLRDSAEGAGRAAGELRVSDVPGTGEGA